MSKQLAKCGTVTAYNRHLRNGEDPCGACLKAKRDKENAANARKRRPKSPIESDTVAGSRLDDLLAQRADLKGAMRWAREENPRAMPQISKELREVNREIEEVRGESALKEDKFSGFFEEGGLSLVSSTG